MRKFFYCLITVMAAVSVIISCASNNDLSSSQETGLIDQNGNVTPIIITNTITNAVDITNYYSNNIPNKAGDYYRIYVPWAGEGDGYYTVNYKDTNRLNQLYLDQIKRKGSDDGRVFAIRNRANDRGIGLFQEPYDGREDYYYFADNGDIYYKGGDKTNKTGITLMKRFVGAVIVDYRRVVRREVQSSTRAADVIQNTGKLTVGAIYKMGIGQFDAQDKFNDANGGPTDGAYEFIAARKRIWEFYGPFQHTFSWFIRRYYNTKFIEVLVLNEDANEGNRDCMGLDAYYAYYAYGNGTVAGNGMPGFQTWNMPYMTDENIYLGERPEFVIPLLTHTTTFTDASRWWSFLVMPGNPESSSTTGRKTTTGRLPRWSW